VIDALPPGAYTVTLIDANGCGRAATYVVPFTTGTQETGLELALYLFPNPADEVIFIRSDQAGPARIIVYNALGQMIVQQQSTRLNTDMDCRTWPLDCIIYRCKWKERAGLLRSLSCNISAAWYLLKIKHEVRDHFFSVISRTLSLRQSTNTGGFVMLSLRNIWILALILRRY